jgi:tetratricopeptide (TPR) repeat protein
MHPVLKARMLYFEGYLMHIDDLRANKIFGEQILSKYKEALQWHHELPHIYKSMGEVHFYQMLQPDSAEHYAQKATEWAPSWTSPYSDLATMYSGVSILSNLKRARYFLEQVDQIDSTAIQTNYWHINNWGRYFLSSNQFNQAEEQFKKIIQLDSTLISGYHNLGNVYFRTKRFPQAEELYKKTIQMDSTNHGAYSNLGTICLYTGKFVDGESYFKKSIELDSTDIKSLSGLARIYILTDRIEKGEDLFQEIIEMDSTSITVYMTAASAYLMTNKPDKAIQKVQELLRIDSLNIDGIPFLARIYVMIGEKEKSEHLFQKALNIGLDFARSGDYNKADRIFQDNGLKFFYTKKQNVQLSYAILYSLQNQLDKAFTSLDKAFENGYQLEDTFIDIKKEPGLAPLRAQKKRWKALLKKYFPDQYKE